MTTFRYEIPIAITLRSPFATRGLVVDRASIDLPLARDGDGRPILPGTLVTGVVRGAVRRLARAAPGNVNLGNETRALADDECELFGRASTQNEQPDRASWRASNEPRRALLAFRDLAVDRDAEAKMIECPQSYPRIRIHEELGSVAEGFLQFVELPFEIGETVTFAGLADLRAGGVGPERVAALLEKALALVPALGAIKSSGFGRVVGYRVGEPAPIVASRTTTGPSTAFGERVRYEVTYEIDRPFLVGGRMASANLFKGSEIIPGGAIKGTLAAALQDADRMTTGMSDLLAELTIGHGFPRPAAGGRPLGPMPQSLAMEGSWLVDRLLDQDAAGDRTLSFQGDLKDSSRLENFLGQDWQAPKFDVRTRTKIDPVTGSAAYERTSDDDEGAGQLFSYAAVKPQGYRWIGRMVVPKGADPALFDEIRGFLQAGLVGLGKTGAKLTGTMQAGGGSAARCDQTFALTLASAAALNDLDRLRGGASLFDDYGHYWGKLGYVLHRFFATQRLEGGYVALRYPPRSDACEPYLLTEPGSVFLVEATADAVPLADLLDLGLPPTAWIEQPDWRNCPFLPTNGFGEVRLDVVDHRALAAGLDLGRGAAA